MLLDLLKNLVRGGSDRGSSSNSGNMVQQNFDEPTPEDLAFIVANMNDPVIFKNMQILFSGSAIGGESFLKLYNDTLQKTYSLVRPHKWYRRAQRALHLSNYFIYSLPLPGAAIECGVARGFSSMLLNTIAGFYPDYKSKDFYMLDSFEGLSEITDNDLVVADDANEVLSSYKQGDMSWSIEKIKTTFAEFPQVKLVKGWIPDAFEQLPEQQWSFVHIDVDLYDPTLTCLEYFYNRMVTGGVIINDDYASPDFPGGGKAWDEFCAANDLPVVALDTGQAVILKE